MVALIGTAILLVAVIVFNLLDKYFDRKDNNMAYNGE